MLAARRLTQRAPSFLVTPSYRLVEEGWRTHELPRVNVNKIPIVQRVPGEAPSFRDLDVYPENFFAEQMEQEKEVMRMDSMVKKRRRKMHRHKYRKRLKRQRFLNRKL